MKIAIIGCGVMGSALARHLAKKHMVALYDHHEEKSKKLASVLGAKASAKKSIKETTQGSDIVILAVKPKD